MADLFDYLEWRGDISVLRDPFNEVDNLVLSQLSYIEFEGIVPEDFREPPVTVYDAAKKFLSADDYRERSSLGPLISEKTLRLIEIIADIPRFSGMKLLGYVNHVDREQETQFAAVTVLLPDDTIYVAFRGTDSNLVGWKEDFNMSFLEKVPAQEEAARYLRNAADFLEGRIRIGGHSKGGNLAVYAAAFASEEIKSRIRDIYNNDGPGFMEETVNGMEFNGLSDRIHTIVPKSSIVGMLLTHGEDYEVVDSVQVGIFQHDPFSWKVRGPGFVHLNGVTQGSMFMDKTLREWIGAMDAQQKKQFVDGLFEVIDAAGCTTLKELSSDKFRKAVQIAKSWKHFDEGTKQMIQRTIQLLLQMVKRNLTVKIPVKELSSRQD